MLRQDIDVCIVVYVVIFFARVYSEGNNVTEAVVFPNSVNKSRNNIYA